MSVEFELYHYGTVLFLYLKSLKEAKNHESNLCLRARKHERTERRPSDDLHAETRDKGKTTFFIVDYQ